MIPYEQLTEDDQAAVAWAASIEHAVAVAAVIRVRGGGDAAISAAELVVVSTMSRSLDLLGRPWPHHSGTRPALLLKLLLADPAEGRMQMIATAR